MATWPGAHDAATWPLDDLATDAASDGTGSNHRRMLMTGSLGRRKRGSGSARGIFVTGTDTGVGKTVVAGALAAWHRARGRDVAVMKPVATGGRWRDIDGTHRLMSDDAIYLARAAQATDPWALINPVCFHEPLAPWTAALRMRRRIPWDRLIRAFRDLCAHHEVVIVEGIGGLLVPLTGRRTVADLAHDFELPLLIVTSPGLGTLNHTLLSLECARRKRLHVLGVLFNQTTPEPKGAAARLAQQTNPDILRRFSGVRILGQLPCSPRVVSSEHHPEALAGWITQHLGSQVLQRLAEAVDTHRGLW